jgi:hypothetical protein
VDVNETQSIVTSIPVLTQIDESDGAQNLMKGDTAVVPPAVVNN